MSPANHRPENGARPNRTVSSWTEKVRGMTTSISKFNIRRCILIECDFKKLEREEVMLWIQVQVLLQVDSWVRFLLFILLNPCWWYLKLLKCWYPNFFFYLFWQVIPTPPQAKLTWPVSCRVKSQAWENQRSFYPCCTLLLMSRNQPSSADHQE